VISILIYTRIPILEFVTVFIYYFILDSGIKQKYFTLAAAIAVALIIATEGASQMTYAQMGGGTGGGKGGKNANGGNGVSGSVQGQFAPGQAAVSAA
jgi:hypothetical protein